MKRQNSFNREAEISKYLDRFAEMALTGTGDSDAHVFTLFSIALASRSLLTVELGVRKGVTTLPLLIAASLNKGHLISVDIEKPNFKCSKKLLKNWEFVHEDSIEFLKNWDSSKKMDLVFVDDWHAYSHVKKELDYLDKYTGPSSLIILHDLMYGNTQPFYHTDLTLREGQWADGGPYRAVAELNPQFWEWVTLPWGNGLTILRKKYSNKYHQK